MNARIRTVGRKEILENSRDRRTILSIFLIGPVFVPALWAIMINFAVSQTIAGGGGPISVPIIDQSQAPNLVDFLNRRGIEASDELDSLSEALAAVAAGDHDLAIVVDTEFAENFRSGSDARVTLVVDQSRARTAGNVRRVQTTLEAYSRQVSALRLQSRGVSPLVLRPITIDEYDVSTAAGRSVILLGVLSYFLIFGTLMGGFYLAIDSTAGERERGSLEPLLTVPATRAELLLGKMAATVFYMLASLLATVAGISVAMTFAPLEELGMTSTFDLLTAAKIILLVAPFTPLGAALMMIVASFTRSYKEAQTYLGLILIVPTLPLIFATVMSVRPSLALMTIPSLSQHLLITEVIRGESLSLTQIVVSVTCTLAGGALLAWIATRLYAREKLLG